MFSLMGASKNHPLACSNLHTSTNILTLMAQAGDKHGTRTYRGGSKFSDMIFILKRQSFKALAKTSHNLIATRLHRTSDFEITFTWAP